jgi:tripartite ATP-independent transporter DctM subunit
VETKEAVRPAGSRAGDLGRYLSGALELATVSLVVLDLVVLLAGVVARYVFNRPLPWSDELASFLFLWLGMLGAVMALSRGEHLRLSAFLRNLSPKARGTVDTFSALAVLVFILEIVRPAYFYTTEQWMITTPGLQIPDSFRVASILVGAALMSVISIYQLAKRSRPRDIVWGAAVLAVAAGLLWSAQGTMTGMGNYNLPIFFILIVGTLVVVGVPIAFAFGVSTLTYLVFATKVPLFIVVNQMDHGMSSLVLLAIPLFVFLGLLIDITGMAAALVGFLVAILGHLRGGLSYVLLGAMYLVSGISGAKAADMAAIAPILLPEMRKRGYQPGETVALLAASSAMSETIPPSLILITIGSVTGVSIAALFTGGLLPAAVGAVALAVVAFFRTAERARGVARPSGREIGKAFLVALPALVLPVIIRYAVVEGVATATEVSTVGVVYTLIVGPLCYKGFTWRKLYPILVETAALSGAILLIIGCATAMGWALTQSGFANSLVATMKALPGGTVTFLALSIVLFAALGSLLEGIPAIVLFGPLLFPVAGALGINDVHYSVVAILAMGLGLFSPPFGLGFYISCAIGRVEPAVAMWRVWPYLGALLLAVILIAAVPWISTGFL